MYHCHPGMVPRMVRDTLDKREQVLLVTVTLSSKKNYYGMSTCIYMALLDSCTSKASLFFRCFLLSLSFSLSLLSSSSLSSLRMWSSNVISWSSLSITVCSRREERGGREEWKEGGGGVRRRGGRREREGERWSLLHILTSLSLPPPRSS